MKTFFSESPDLTSPGLSSEDFYVGIKASRIQFNNCFVAILLTQKGRQRLKVPVPCSACTVCVLTVRSGTQRDGYAAVEIV